MAYSVSKAAGEFVKNASKKKEALMQPHKGLHLMKCLAFTQGPKIRINAVLPGLLLTEWVRSVNLHLIPGHELKPIRVPNSARNA